jgi:DNA (cytosine-5)-methyltransferase 1
MSNLNVISLFTGAGGLDLGFSAAGFNIALASDIMDEACDTLRSSKTGSAVFGPPFHSGSVYDLDVKTIKSLAGITPGKIDVMVGGPPCQPFSVAAAQRFLKSDTKFKRKGFGCEEKGQLIFAYVRLIIELMPKVFLIENVPGILSIDGGESINLVISVLEDAGYTISSPMVLDAKDYGVPQNRKRAFIVGNLDGKKLQVPDPTHSKTPSLFSKKHRSVADALCGFDFTMPNSEIRNHAQESLKRYKKLKTGQRERLGRVDRLDPNLPSKTVIAGGASGGGRSHLHPFQARTLSVRECARLQTFPDSYVFNGKNGRQFTQVGNAVPPLLAEVLARQIMTTFFKKSVPPNPVHQIPDNSSSSYSELLKWSIETRPDLLYNDIRTEIN